MTINLLDHFLLSQMGAFLLIFCRVGSALMVLPGFGEIYVNPRIRLLFALAFAFLLTPMLQSRLPLMPESPIALSVMMIGEVLVGVFIGLIARAILMSLHVAGSMIAQQSSLAVASMFDPTSGAHSPVVSNLLSLTAITLFFALNLHFLVLAAIVQSYDIFAAGVFPDVADMNMLHTRIVTDAFKLGVLLSAPHVVFSLLLYLAGGLMMRLMPNFQVFFVMMAPHILIAFLLLMAILPVILNIYTNFAEQQFMDFIKVE